MIFKKVEDLREKLNNSCDVIIREIICGKKNLNAIFLKSTIDEELFINGILSPIIDFGSELNGKELPQDINLDILINKVLKVRDVEKIEEDAEIMEKINNYNVLIFIEDEDSALAIDIADYPSRNPNEPPTSSVTKGPREGFVEDYKKNVSLLRRRFPADKMITQKIKIGKYSQTDVVITYIKDIADIEIVKRIKDKLKNIDIDGVIDSYYLVGFLQDKKKSMFKQVGSCEKPDIVASKMLEGRIAIIVNNSPIVLTVPFLFLEDLQNSNDYYSSQYYASYVRVIRLIGIFIAALLPGLYVTLRLFHYNVMPINFLMTIGNASEAIPFTPFLEMVFVLILFEILYEVSLRLPRYLGLATSVVGALILGDTGVKAGLLSSPTVMIVALSVISVYTVPDQVDQISLLRVVFLIVGPALGILGLIAAVVFAVAYMNTLNSFNTPYLAPYSPYIKNDMKDSLIKVRVSKMKNRPKSLENKNKVRLSYGESD
ncbi:MAG: spore germination protein [Clostridia bacterium]|nr:spore germination protein [Clostridia bacterium]